MPLSEPAARERVHTRRVTCEGFRRDDGLWDIEGHLVDTKSYGFPSRWRGEVKAGEPIHEMWLRLTVDARMTVRAIEARTDHSPFPMCPDITPNFQRLVGLRIGPGWRRAVAERLGGTQGCTHLVELLGPLATTAYQTLYSERERQRRGDAGPPKERPRIIDSCHALASDGPVVAEQWPQFYTGGTRAEPAKAGD